MLHAQTHQPVLRCCRVKQTKRAGLHKAVEAAASVADVSLDRKELSEDDKLRYRLLEDLEKGAEAKLLAVMQFPPGTTPGRGQKQALVQALCERRRELFKKRWVTMASRAAR
jgi:hypothetical protein